MHWEMCNKVIVFYRFWRPQIFIQNGSSVIQKRPPWKQSHQSLIGNLMIHVIYTYIKQQICTADIYVDILITTMPFLVRFIEQINNVYCIYHIYIYIYIEREYIYNIYIFRTFLWQQILCRKNCTLNCMPSEYDKKQFLFFCWPVWFIFTHVSESRLWLNNDTESESIFFSRE